MSKLGDLKLKLMLDYYYFINKIDLIFGVWSPNVLSVNETMDKIINENLSISRIGDGEFKWMLDMPQNSFQKQSNELKEALIRILHDDNPNLLICVSDCFGSLDCYKKDSQKFWSMIMVKERKRLKKIFPENYTFGNLNITRFYIDFKNTSHIPQLLSKWNKVFENRDIVIIEGEYTRLGVGNDLLKKANSIHRIIAPAENAFEKYDKIKTLVLDTVRLDQLILIALGPTATILAADLAEVGYQAIDIGHIDIEYEWYRSKAKSKIPVKSKYVNEASKMGGRNVNDIDNEKDKSEYVSQIIGTIV